MERGHIAISSFLGHGNVFPILPLCSELVARGYRVTYPTDRYYAEKIAETGAQALPFVPFEDDGWYERELKERRDLLTNDSRWYSWDRGANNRFAAETRAFLSQVEPYYLRDAPDLVIYDHDYPVARILARRLRSPVVQVTASLLADRRPSDPAFWRNDGVCVTENGSRMFDEMLSEFGIDTKGNFWHFEDLNISLVPPEFQRESERFDRRFVFVGRSLNRSFKNVWQDRSNGRPVILISGFSGLHDIRVRINTFFAAAIDALADSPYYCVLSVGDHDADHGLPPLPNNFELNQHASHLEILPRAALAICHGGLGTTLEALYHGVPVLAISLNPFTGQVARRVAELGVGTHLERDEATPRKIRVIVDEMVSSPPLAREVRSLQHAFQNAGGARIAVDRIESFLGTLRGSELRQS